MRGLGGGNARGIKWFTAKYEQLQRSVESFIRGKPGVVEAALVCLLSEGHLLIDDAPGVGKTSLAKAIARSIDAEMRRIQFTPDLLPSDVTGVQIYDTGSAQFRFVEGPVFAHVVLADEINRASPKTQAALLEVMSERQVTIDGKTHVLDDPFVVLATSNPVEHAGVYRLPEAQLDRFLMRIEMGYPSPVAEREIMDAQLRGLSVDELHPVLTLDDVRDMIASTRSVAVAPTLQEYIITVAAATRTREECELGVSPRGSGALAVASRAMAAVHGREYVTSDDVKALAPKVLAHRMILRPEVERTGRTTTDVLADILDEVPVPEAQMT
jgi:MoxR-like ATPase